jgi:hypothetical protein
MLNPKNSYLEVCRYFPRQPSSPIPKSLDFYNSAIYHPILIKFGTQPKKIMLNLKNTEAENWPTLSKMAATTILKSLGVLIISFLSCDFDDIWYTT